MMIKKLILLLLFSFSLINPCFSAVIDSYPIENQDNSSGMYDGVQEQVGQSFTLTSAYTITSVKFYLTKLGTPVGNVYAKLYAATGTVGTNAIPTGSVLATSNGVAATDLTAWTTFGLVEFTFATPYAAAAGDYCVLVEYNSDIAPDYIRIGMDITSTTHGGNMFFTDTADSGWSSSGYATYDAIFYLYGTLARKLIIMIQ